MVQEMLEQGVVQHSQSPWTSPVVLITKHDGTMGFCADYRHLNLQDIGKSGWHQSQLRKLHLPLILGCMSL